MIPDGDLDLALNGRLASNEARTYLYRNEHGHFSEAARLGDTYGGMVAWGDVDNDGDLDLLNAGFRSCANTLTDYLYRNDSGRYHRLCLSHLGPTRLWQWRGGLG